MVRSQNPAIWLSNPVIACTDLDMCEGLAHNADLANGQGYRDTRLKPMTRVMTSDHVSDTQANKQMQYNVCATHPHTARTCRETLLLARQDGKLLFQTPARC